MSDLGTTAFDNSEKIDILIKENFNVSSTNENTPWYLENNATFNTYVNGKDILLDEIPNNVNWSSASSLTISELSSIYGLTPSDFYSGGGVKVDSTGVLHKFIKLKLQPIQGTSITSGSTTTYFSYYHKNSNGINLLENSFQLNHGDGSSFAYYMYSNAGVASDVSILQDSNGGNWFFNFKNGIVFVPDPTKNSTMLSNVNQNNLPYFTFVKYVGRKGIAKQISVVQNKTTITNPENNQIAVQTSDNTLHRYDTSTTSWISVGGSGGGGGSSSGQIGTQILNVSTQYYILEQMKLNVDGGFFKNSKGEDKKLNISPEIVIPYKENNDGDGWYKFDIFDDTNGFYPPEGAKQVDIKFTAFLSFNNEFEIFNQDALLEWYFAIDNININSSRRIAHLDLVEQYAFIDLSITIDDTLLADDLENNKLIKWDADKQISIYARSLDSSQLVKLHKKQPNIEITSIGPGITNGTTNGTSGNGTSGNGTSGNGTSGNGVTVIPSTASVDLSENILYPTANTGSGKEGDIIYDASENLFYEASNSKTDTTGNGEIAFRPLGYSFFAKNMEGQAPNVQSTSFFFFELTPSSIVLHWRNPFQYETGITASPSQLLNETSPIVSQPSGDVGGKINFPIVNRIMMQIKNIETKQYITWGSKRSPISQYVTGLTGGYVICSKHYPIPPMNSNRNFGIALSDGGRSGSVYKLEDFAESIILYSAGNTPTNDIIKSGISSYSKRIFPVSGETNKELSSSTDGYEIKFWYENEYKADPNSTLENGWGMNENDFNVITLNQAKDLSGDLILEEGKINFLAVQPPSEAVDCSCSIVFNNLGNVSDGCTIVEIKVKDPEKTTSTGSQYNTTINLTEIKFEYRNEASSGTTNGWNIIKKLFNKNAGSTSNNTSIATKGQQGLKVILSSGVYSINRKRDDNYRYFYVELNNDMLGVTNFAMEKYLSFRVSYKNASIDEFGPRKVSNELVFDKPNKPIISQIKMTSYNTFTITLASFNDREDIIGDTTDISNNNMGVFLRNINFNVSYQYSNEDSQTDISPFTEIEIEGGESSQTTSTNTSVYINTTSFGSSTYTYTLPAGFYPNGSTNTNTNSITYYFSASVQNNLIEDYSDFSDQQSIQITKPNQTNDSINFTILDSTSNKNNTLRVSWSHPTDGERGIVTSQSSTGLPKIQKYTFKSTHLKDNNDDTNVDHGVTDINSASNRYSDPSTTKEFTFYDALKYDESNLTKTIYGGLDIEIKEYNEYVNNSSTFSNTISATATKPGEATNLRNDTINILTSTIKNNTTILWTAPLTNQRGLTIGNAARDNTIIQYDISINRVTTNKYLLGKNAESTPSFTTTNYTTTITNGDNSSDKTSTTDPSGSLSLDNLLGGSDMFLWPDSTYTFEVKTTNSLGYQTTGVNKSFTTQAPSIPSGLNYFDNDRLVTLTNGKTTDLSNNSHYLNKGVLVSSDISTSTSYSGTLVQITKLFSTSKPTDITSNTVHHVLNKTSFQDSTWNNSNATVVSWTDSNPPSSSNQSHFKVFNVAPTTNIEVYTIGTSSDFSNDSGVNKDSVGIKFDITRANRKDGYKYNNNYDSRNYGYWYSESINYTITFTTGNVRAADLYTPLKYELRSYYNNSGNGTVSTDAGGSTVILQNTNNTNGNYIYFDDSCTGVPSVSKYSGSDMISYTTNNKINGIPNLHLFNSQTATITLTYTASGYSKRYLLNKDLNALEHYFSYSTGNKKAIITWNNHTSSAPSISSNKYKRQQNQWNVSGLSITSFPSTSTATVGITLKITAQNTFGNGEKTIGSGDSTVYNFIYDKPSVDFYNSLGTTLKKAKQIISTDTNAPGNYDALDNTTDSNQLNMWNGWFYSKLGWATSTGISTTNCSNYGLSTSDVMFQGNDTDYKFVIFEYSYTAVSGYTPFGGFVVFGDNADFKLSDIAGGVYGGKTDIKLYLFIQSYNMNSHYYLDIGKYTSTTFGSAAGGNIAGYNDSGLGKVPYTSSSDDTNWSSGGSLIPTSGNGGWGTASSSDYTNRPSSSNLKRTINFIYNKVGNYNSNTNGQTFKHYLCIGIKNSINRKVKKPDLYIYAGASTVKKLT